MATTATTATAAPQYGDAPPRRDSHGGDTDVHKLRANAHTDRASIRRSLDTATEDAELKARQEVAAEEAELNTRREVAAEEAELDARRNFERSAAAKKAKTEARRAIARKEAADEAARRKRQALAAEKRRAAERKAAAQAVQPRRERAANVPATGRGAVALNEALAQRGKPYVWGAVGPSSFDCSGLMQYAYRRAGIELPRTTWGQITAGRRVSVSEARPGDLVFYRGAAHVGMYMGGGQVVHAPRPGRNVRVESVHTMPVYAVVRPT
ncbi:C40 family peptidase [Streptomyces sp. NPDC060022]|uniref:C40 family peptidase n=1 Tax=Streptomyces sp. NPDC060022 TaxID=3347039 RepID=UPI00369C8E84